MKLVRCFLNEAVTLKVKNSVYFTGRFIFKGDADVYVNIENILEMLQDKNASEDLFIGDIIVHAKPIRKRTSKYYVPEFMYGGGLYPSYAGGGGFVMSGHTARRLSAACQQVGTLSATTMNVFGLKGTYYTPRCECD